MRDYLRRTADNHNNWTFEKKEKKSRWELDLDRVVFSKGSIHFVDAVEDIDATARIGGGDVEVADVRADKRGDQAAMLMRAHIETSQSEVRKITLHQVHLARQGALAR